MSVLQQPPFSGPFKEISFNRLICQYDFLESKFSKYTNPAFSSVDLRLGSILNILYYCMTQLEYKINTDTKKQFICGKRLGYQPF